MALFEKVAILGVGLLGASLGMALKKKGLAGEVYAWSRSASTREKCSQKPWCGKVFEDVVSLVSDADLVVLCSTVDSIKTLSKQIAPYLKKGAIVTDVGSTKAKLCSACESYINGAGAYFVGSHPMAGSEKSGLEFADEDLFLSKPCFITPCFDAEASSAAVGKIEAMWAGLGMVVYKVSAENHDAIVARISHLPHIIAAMLAVNVSKYSDVESLKSFVGTGFKDTTRVASSSSDMWSAIIADNDEQILKSLKAYIEDLSAFVRNLENKDFTSIKELLERGKIFRNSL